MTGYFLTEQDILLQKTVREFANNQLAPNAGHYDQKAEFPWENFQALAELGLFGLTIDEDFGGTGGTGLQSAIVVEELSRRCAATARRRLFREPHARQLGCNHKHGLVSGFPAGPFAGAVAGAGAVSVAGAVAVAVAVEDPGCQNREVRVFRSRLIFFKYFSFIFLKIPIR